MKKRFFEKEHNRMNNDGYKKIYTLLKIHLAKFMSKI